MRRRRSWLLARLGAVLDYAAADPRRLLALLSLPDEELIATLAGSRASRLKADHEAWSDERCAPCDGCGESLRGRRTTVCRHSSGLSWAPGTPAAPAALTLTCDRDRLRSLTSSPVIAVLGTPAASDYGAELAHSLACGVSARGATVIAPLATGIAAAAHAGAIDAGGASIAVLAGGLDVACPAALESLYARIARDGCGLSELPADCPGRRWGILGAERVVVALAQVSVVVEAEDSARALASAHMVGEFGRPLAAVPGRVTSPLSAGPHALLRAGGTLVRGSEDLLALAGELPASEDVGAAARSPPLPPSLNATLARVGLGVDTAQALTDRGDDAWATLGRLGELEALGLLSRGHGGRYVASAARGEPQRRARDVG